MNEIVLLIEAFWGPFLFAFVALMIWSVVWKGLALWKAARLADTWWFVALLLINTVGILEILYIYIFSKRESSAQNQDATNSK